jgi:hypothetical protein
MASDVTVAAVVSGMLAGGFALCGATLTETLSRRRERRAFRTETAIELADVGRAMWKDDWIDMNVRLERQRARLGVAGCPSDLVDAAEDITLACWRDVARDRDADVPKEFIGINSGLLDASRLVRRAVTASLLKQRGRRKLRRQAVDQAKAAIANR